jgi:hypothetical protein
MGEDDRMPRLQTCLSAAVVALVTAWSAAALADVAPPDGCTAGAGTACNNAGPSANQPGICTASTCPHTGPGPDGGIVTTENPCVLCQVQSSGSSSATSAGATSSGTAASGSGGCTVGVTPSEGAGTMLLVGAGLLLASRRRRRG